MVESSPASQRLTAHRRSKTLENVEGHSDKSETCRAPEVQDLGERGGSFRQVKELAAHQGSKTLTSCHIKQQNSTAYRLGFPDTGQHRRP